MAGFKTFTSTTLTASDVNGYLMRQTVIQCTSGTRPSSPHEGMLIWETDTDSYVACTNATGPVWTTIWRVAPVAVLAETAQAFTAGGAAIYFGTEYVDAYSLLSGSSVMVPSVLTVPRTGWWDFEIQGTLSSGSTIGAGGYLAIYHGGSGGSIPRYSPAQYVVAGASAIHIFRKMRVIAGDTITFSLDPQSSGSWNLLLGAQETAVG